MIFFLYLYSCVYLCVFIFVLLWATKLFHRVFVNNYVQILISIIYLLLHGWFQEVFSLLGLLLNICILLCSNFRFFFVFSFGDWFTNEILLFDSNYITAIFLICTLKKFNKILRQLLVIYFLIWHSSSTISIKHFMTTSANYI